MNAPEVLGTDPALLATLLRVPPGFESWENLGISVGAGVGAGVGLGVGLSRCGVEWELDVVVGHCVVAYGHPERPGQDMRPDGVNNLQC